MFTLTPESIRKLHGTPLTFSKTNGALTSLAYISNLNMFSSSELDGVSRGTDLRSTWLTLFEGLGLPFQWFPLC